MTERYRRGLPERPPQIARLPLDARGYPIPFFVAYIDGKPDFRVVDHDKVVNAVRARRCFICGEPLGLEACFATGPRSAILMQTAHGPSHIACIEYSLQTCPFILYPDTQRRRAAMPEIPWSVDEAVTTERPPIYVVVRVSSTLRVSDQPPPLRCAWDEIDYRYWQDDHWITAQQARPYVVRALEELIASVDTARTPPEWSATRLERWRAAQRDALRARAKRVLARIDAAGE